MSDVASLAQGWGRFLRTVERVRRERRGERIVRLHRDDDVDSDE